MKKLSHQQLRGLSKVTQLINIPNLPPPLKSGQRANAVSLVSGGEGTVFWHQTNQAPIYVPLKGVASLKYSEDTFVLET